MSGNNSRSVGLIYIWQREQISKWTLLGFLDIFQNKLDIGAFFISFIPVHATNGVLQTSSISYFDPFSSLFLLNFYIRIWVILVPQVPKNHHLHSFWLVTAWHCIITTIQVIKSTKWVVSELIVFFFDCAICRWEFSLAAI